MAIMYKGARSGLPLEATPFVIAPDKRQVVIYPFSRKLTYSPISIFDFLDARHHIKINAVLPQLLHSP
jgi:hypothetical protein